MTAGPVLTIRAIKAVGVEVPMTYVLGTSRTAVSAAPLLLIDLETEEGVFCASRCASSTGERSCPIDPGTGCPGTRQRSSAIACRFGDARLSALSFRLFSS
jgi:hypothetical protein